MTTPLQPCSFYQRQHVPVTLVNEDEFEFVCSHAVNCIEEAASKEPFRPREFLLANRACLVTRFGNRSVELSVDLIENIFATQGFESEYTAVFAERQLIIKRRQKLLKGTKTFQFLVNSKTGDHYGNDSSMLLRAKSTVLVVATPLAMLARLSHDVCRQPTQIPRTIGYSAAMTVSAVGGILFPRLGREAYGYLERQYRRQPTIESRDCRGGYYLAMCFQPISNASIRKEGLSPLYGGYHNYKLNKYLQRNGYRAFYATPRQQETFASRYIKQLQAIQLPPSSSLNWGTRQRVAASQNASKHYFVFKSSLWAAIRDHRIIPARNAASPKAMEIYAASQRYPCELEANESSVRTLRRRFSLDPKGGMCFGMSLDFISMCLQPKPGQALPTYEELLVGVAGNFIDGAPPESVFLQTWFQKSRTDFAKAKVAKAIGLLCKSVESVAKKGIYLLSMQNLRGSRAHSLSLVWVSEDEIYLFDPNFGLARFASNIEVKKVMDLMTRTYDRIFAYQMTPLPEALDASHFERKSNP